MTRTPLFLSLALAGIAGLQAAPTYPIVTTGQDRCYDNDSAIATPKPGAAFYGQDANHPGRPFAYTAGKDGLTVNDTVTGLVWQSSPDTNGDGALDRRDKLTLSQTQALPAKLNAKKFGGYSDWRLPTLKELYSLFDARGTDPSGMQGDDTSSLRPYLDTKFFKFAYGNTATGERVIDSQYASATKYVGKSPRGGDKLFGVNFADGRIKGYDTSMPGGAEKGFFVICVRGNPKYGVNDFKDNADGTVTDLATGLMWTKGDNGADGLDWKGALAWVAAKNAARHLGHADWRLPTIKELQSLVDYTRSPDTSDSPAIDPVFTCTPIVNEAGVKDYAYYWSGTTHTGMRGGAAAMYIAFGRAGGFLSERALSGGAPSKAPSTGPVKFVDVHGAGAQRSDPKTGDASAFPRGRGPQGDVIRIQNKVRLVRDA